MQGVFWVINFSERVLRTYLWQRPTHDYFTTLALLKLHQQLPLTFLPSSALMPSVQMLKISSVAATKLTGSVLKFSVGTRLNGNPGFISWTAHKSYKQIISRDITQRGNIMASRDLTSPTNFPCNSTDSCSRKRFRSADINRYKLITTRLKFGERCFSHAGPIAWNELSTELQDLTVHSAFRRQLKTFLFEHAFTTQWQSYRWSRDGQIAFALLHKCSCRLWLISCQLLSLCIMCLFVLHCMFMSSIFCCFTVT